MKKPSNEEFGPPYAVINLSKVGVRYFRICVLASEKTRKTIVTLLENHPNVVWVFSAKGWFNLAIGFWAHDNAEITDISSSIRDLLSQDDQIVLQSELTSLIGFGNRPVTKKGSPMIIVDGTHTAKELSPVEIDLLKILTLDNTYSANTLSSLIGVSVKSVKDSLKSLRDRGVIVGSQRRLNYKGTYLKVFIDTNSSKLSDAPKKLEELLWKDSKCIYLARANGKYDLEFEMIVKNKKVLKKYIQDFSEVKIVELLENLHTNLFPINKAANLTDIKKALVKKDGVYDLRDSKLWYLNHKGGSAYVDIFKNKKYSLLMNMPETSLFKNVANKIKDIFSFKQYHIIDIGSGNGMKGDKLCNAFGVKSVKAYYPLDISPIELATAVKENQGFGYEIKPVVVDFKNMGTKFPIKTIPNEGQVYAFLGGTYGNFPYSQINSYLRPLINSNSSALLITMPIYPQKLPKEAIEESYATLSYEDVSFSPLLTLGFKKSDFEYNRKFPNLRVHIIFENRRLVSTYILNRGMKVNGITFKKGDLFKMTTSWKPTLQDFRDALKEFNVREIVHNDKMAIAIITK